ncbi:hypothetical protein C8A03DRAFT_32984 [Achaetomium macrosporum]|uniref:Uncharacterized protein n=1 Tax=Achaetomium macrosporum TaxID=79813 RepID=A0AAN7CBH1_9PEZI|nr:hypothetical protein C8A03DRAFT_32984 [Achaetomium macrosporum]
MPISLPTGGDSTADMREVLTTRVLFPPLDFTTARGKQVAAIILCRALYNLVHLFLAGYSRWPFVIALWHVADQCVANYCVTLIAEAEGERRVFGGRLRFSRKHFDIFLVVLAVIHVFWVFILIACILSYAIFFGVTGGEVLAVVEVAILPIAWIASRPEADEGDLGLA